MTLKALEELEALEIELAEEDVHLVLSRLRKTDFFSEIISRTTAEPMYVFKPVVEETVLYVKLILRVDCIVISFHEDEV